MLLIDTKRLENRMGMIEKTDFENLMCEFSPSSKAKECPEGNVYQKYENFKR